MLLFELNKYICKMWNQIIRRFFGWKYEIFQGDEMISFTYKTCFSQYQIICEAKREMVLLGGDSFKVQKLNLQ